MQKTKRRFLLIVGPSVLVTILIMLFGWGVVSFPSLPPAPTAVPTQSVKIVVVTATAMPTLTPVPPTAVPIVVVETVVVTATPAPMVSTAVAVEPVPTSVVDPTPEPPTVMFVDMGFVVVPIDRKTWGLFMYIPVMALMFGIGNRMLKFIRKFFYP